MPGTENNLEKKEFTWSLVRFDSEELEISIYFENPTYISMEAYDYLKISFSNTSIVMSPEK